MKLAAFRCDVTPPLGSPLCGGWITPAVRVDDPQYAVGVVLTEVDAGPPVVLCAVDWCELRNASYQRWREALAAAVGTVAERVAVHCVHPHDAFFADHDAQEFLDAAGAGHDFVHRAFFDTAVDRAATAAREALARLAPVTHVGAGQARVEQVASNRRVMGPDGKVRGVRYSSCRDAELRAAPEGTIDPFLKTVAFWEGDRLLAALHYYATHPQSHYGKGGVSCDFPGLARDRVEREVGAPQIYFTGAAGNVTAGKYNDGAPENREALTARLAAGIRGALAVAERRPLTRSAWSAVPLTLPSRAEFTEEHSRSLLHDPDRNLMERIRGALQLGWLQRAARPIDLTCLALDDLRLLHLPGEPFVEYQLFAQKAAPGRFVALAGYGDAGPGYVCTDVAFDEGGYESSWVALVGPGTEEVLKEGITGLLI
jgi:hypothetical protein